MVIKVLLNLAPNDLVACSLELGLDSAADLVGAILEDVGGGTVGRVVLIVAHIHIATPVLADPETMPLTVYPFSEILFAIFPFEVAKSMPLVILPITGVCPLLVLILTEPMPSIE